MKQEFSKLLWAFSFLIAVLQFGTAARADEASLYDAPIPADKALVRFLNVKLKFGTQIDMSGQAFSLGSLVLSPYSIVQNGSYVITEGEAEKEFTFEPGNFYTVAVGFEHEGSESIVVLNDKEVENPSKSLLTFYNFSQGEADLSLKLKGDKRVLFKAVQPGEMNSKELPVIDIGLEASVEGKPAGDYEAVALTADKPRNVVVVENSSGVSAHLLTTEISKDSQ